MTRCRKFCLGLLVVLAVLALSPRTDALPQDLPQEAETFFKKAGNHTNNWAVLVRSKASLSPAFSFPPLPASSSAADESSSHLDLFAFWQ